MLGLILKMEAVPGTIIGTAAIEAKRLSDMLDVIVEFEFNGVILRATRKKDARQIVDEYLKRCESKILPFSPETNELIKKTRKLGESITKPERW